MPDTFRPDTLRPDTLRPDTLRPDTLRPDTLLPAASRPDTLLPAASRPATASTVAPTAPGPEPFTAPLPLPPLRPTATLLFCLLSVVPLAVVMGLRLAYVFTQADTTYYLNTAYGRPSVLPFASRQLGPLTVRGIAALAHISIEKAFELEGLAALIFFAGTVFYLLLRSGAPRWTVPALAGLSFWAFQYNGLVMPDLLYAALLCIFILLLQPEDAREPAPNFGRGRILLAALMLLPLTVSRESTLLTLLCFLLAGWRRLRLAEVLTALASTFAGTVLVRHLTRNALPNQEHISPTLYLFAKMPWNFLKNFTGITPWANVYRSCEVPRWQVALHAGSLTGIGICGEDWHYPATFLFSALATFGLLPLLVLRLRPRIVAILRAPAPGVHADDLALRFSLIYGLVSFLLAGLLGESFVRLFDYSWPLFFIALPTLLGATGASFASIRAGVAFLALHLSVSWLDVRVRHVDRVPLALALYGLGWLLVRRTWRPAAAPATARSAAAGGAAV